MNNTVVRFIVRRSLELEIFFSEFAVSSSKRKRDKVILSLNANTNPNPNPNPNLQTLTLSAILNLEPQP